MWISSYELLQIVVMCVSLGYIFMDYIKPPKHNYDPLNMQRFDWDNFWFAMAVTAPAIVLHEFGHKFVALAFGATATLHAAYMWIAIAIILKLMKSPVLMFVAAFVAISGRVTYGQSALISLAGPGVNFLIFLTASLLLKYQKFSHKVTLGLIMTKRVNMILMIFNMLPIPGFDGWGFFHSMYKLIF